ncbi:MAG: hypothetical protein CLLPBCKN_003075 [Chroococcidiopsis cubana SAG 39.79]|jgi:hypothetical protein|uniref:Pyruvate dehydrogenase subunit E1 n=2 Tax=Chroococcidiopsis TaxID=54298 RepID=K9TWQ1_CHRTP|nr:MULTISPECIES: hypothetical protein [Chroococcidiopsis]PSB41326.1 hypothetical protein C7B80_31085 [Cyanosarcina cf. burmensis CCALA 770]AFY86424.1 pyruvate dehydrogenase subunit E1 [Chroococcidiopsis thermalis PCC 7203]MDZ4873679.1 hypothetical protein [Chroococcidiopsis cubana SAG 39.79]PSB55147.1 hypothetical protein C7B79_33905 [Chroococcidiopsis cubana CCALA 043]RUT03712.1 hypothetical protein DSM107010_59950 [Chroococcidiopsis cubana SAG 39.79]
MTNEVKKLSIRELAKLPRESQDKILLEQIAALPEMCFISGSEEMEWVEEYQEEDPEDEIW